MQPEAGLLIIFAAAIFSIAYAIFLIRFGIIGHGKKREIEGATEFVQFNLLRRGNNYAKMVQGVLHFDLFHRKDYAHLLRSLNYPIFIIFGPHLCWKTYTFLKVFKEVKNIRLFQFLASEVQDIMGEKELEITIKRNQHCLIVDGAHCFVEKPHREDMSPTGGWECEDNIFMASKYEDIFDLLIMFCKEISKEQVIRSVGLDNIHIITREKYQPVIALERDYAHKLLHDFAVKIGEEKEFEDLWEERMSTLQRSSHN